jgi:hypothetical protein
MAYTAVKLADVNKAIAAVKTAQSNYATSLSSTAPSKTALETAQKNLEAATAKLQAMRDAFDKESYLQNNSAYNGALDAAKTAEQKLNEARDFLDSGRYYRDNSNYNNDVNAFNSANEKLNQLRDFKDSGQYLRDNSAYQNAVNAIEPKINALREAENKLDNWSGNRSGTAWNNAVTARANADKAVSAAYTAKDKAEQAASTAADTLIRNQENTRNAAETKFNKTRETLETNANKARETAENNLNLARTKIDTVRDSSRNTAEKAINTQDQSIYKSNGIQSLYDQARDKYQNVVDQTQSNLDAYKDTKNNVFNYVNDIKNSLGDVTTKEDATAVKTLLSQIETSVNGTGISDFKNEVAPLIKEIDPLKMANISAPEASSTKPLNSAFKNANPSNFSNIDPNTGLPVLNQEALDRVLNKYGDNSLTPGQYRDNYNAFGWNVKSDASSVTKGAALVGLDMGKIQAGMQTTPGYVKAGTATAATDADFKKAAEELELDFNSYVQPNKFVAATGSGITAGYVEKPNAKNSREYTNPNTGETYLARIDSKGNFTTSLDKESLYSEIDNRLKDFYVVGNVLDPKGANKASPHAAVLFKADGNGNLVPVTKQDGSVAATYYDAASVSHAGWKGQLAELAPLIAVASAIFLPGIGSALAQSIGNATIGTAAAVAPTAFTVGLPAASISLGSVIGATGVNALTGSIINGGMAVLTGGDVGKAMLSGAAGAAAAVSAGDIANKIMGGGQTGASNIAAIAKAANLSVSQTEKIIASGVASGLTSAVTDPDNAFKNMAISIASNFTSEEAKNIVSGSVDPKSVNGLTTFVSNAVDLGTSALMNGQDVGKVLQNAAPSLASGAAQAQSKYVTPVNVSSGASGFPINEDLLKTLDLAKNAGIDYEDLQDIIGASTPALKKAEDYYSSLAKSDFDEDVAKQLKSIFPEMGASDLKVLADSLTRDVAATSFGLPTYALEKQDLLPTSPNQLSKENQTLYIELIKNGYNEDSALLEAALVDPKYSDAADKYLYLQSSFAGPVDQLTLTQLKKTADPLLEQIASEKGLTETQTRIKQLQKNIDDLIYATGERSQQFPVKDGKTTTFLNLSEQKKASTPLGDKSLIDVGGGTSGGSGSAGSGLIPFELIGVTTKGDPSFVSGDGEIYTLVKIDGKDTLVNSKQLDVVLNLDKDPEKEVTKLTLDTKDVTEADAKKLRANAAKDATYSVVNNKNDLALIDPESKTVTSDIENLKKQIVSQKVGGNEGAAGGAGSGAPTASADLVNQLLAKSAPAQQSELDKFLEEFYKNNQPENQENAPTDIKKEVSDWFNQNVDKSEDPLKQKLLLSLSTNDAVFKQYLDNASKKASQAGGNQPSGIPSGGLPPGGGQPSGNQPTGKNFKDILSDALSSLKSDVDTMFAPGTDTAGDGGIGGDTAGYGKVTGGGTGAGTSGVGTTAGGTGTGTGTGKGSGDADAEKAARAKRQNYYNQMMGVASLPTTPASTKQTSPSQAFYYGKDFGSPTQSIAETGELVQKPYQALSVTQPGKEVAPTGVTGENDVSALLSNILSQGDETSLNDLLEIMGGSQYGI